MKAARNPPRLEVRRSGSALIAASMLLSLCVLYLIKARYCSAPYGASSQTQPEGMEIAKSGSEKSYESVAEDEDEAIDAEKPVIKWSKLECLSTSKRSNVCTAEGDIRLNARSRTIFLHPYLADEEQKIKPYCRKHDPTTMKNVTEWTLKPFPANEPAPRCTVKHAVPALVFSIGGFTGNLFHDFTDVLVPLFVAARPFRRKVQFVTPDAKDWWVDKFVLILKQLSKYDVIDADNDDPAAVHCFPRVVVGLSFHKVLSIDPAKAPGGSSMADFRAMLRRAYGLKRATVEDRLGKPRLLIISRNKTRVFLNEQEVVSLAASLGFEVRSAEPHLKKDLDKFARLVNTMDVLVGVHGAGLTNMVFLPAGAVVIQVVPFGGLEWLANETFKDPSAAMQVKYLDYYIKADESSLSDEYPKDHPVLKDPYGLHKKGWPEISKIYLENQNVRPRLDRFRITLLEALNHLPPNSTD